MTPPAPVRDSVLDALGFAIRVVAKPSYWWAPTLLMAVSFIPILALPASPGAPYGQPPFAPAPFATQAEVEAYFRSLVPIIVLSTVLSIVLTPVTAALAYRLAKQFDDGEPPRPFGPGLGGLAWRIFLQTLAFLLLVIVAWLLLAVVFLIAFALNAVAFGFLVAAIGGLVGFFFVFLRLALAPILLLWGGGPIEAIRRSWQITRGHLGIVFRWLFVTALVVGLAAGVVSAALSFAFAAVGPTTIGQFLGSLLYGPFLVVDAVVFIRLLHVLTGPVAPPLQPELPAWLNAPGPVEPAAAPTVSE